jgi:diguanylate cyclase (GGDEF)-like protein
MMGIPAMTIHSDWGVTMSGSGLALPVCAVLAAVAISWRALRSRGRTRVAWLLLTAGVLSWVVADRAPRALWDVGHLASFAGTVGGLLLLPRQPTRGRDARRAGLDVALVAGLVLAVGWALLVRPAGQLVDAAWVAGYVFAAVAALAPEPVRRSAGATPLRCVLLPYAAVFPVAATVVVAASAGTADPPLILAGVVVVALLLVSQVVTGLDHARLVRRLTLVEDDRRELVERLCRDELTGLANRARLAERLDEALRTRPVGLLCVDLDGFKAVNDGLGPGTGDRLLVEAGRRIAECAGPRDTVARLGGDEFALLRERTASSPGLLGLAESVRDVLARPYVLGSETVTVTASTGVALAAAGSGDATTVLRNADLAMHRAKSAGGNRCTLFEPSMHVAAVRRRELERDLRVAVDRGDLRLAYQPIIDLTTGRLTGVEALLRWDGPAGPVEPVDFVPLAEETGLIVPIGRWILDSACAQLADWREAGHDPLLSVNVSARQLLDPRLPAQVHAALTRHDVPPDRLMLELTESVLVDDGAATALGRLRALGVHLALDDFGTGWSSLSYLQHLPVDTVKVDRSFTEELGSGRGLTRAVVAISRELDLDLIVEGVERPAQARWLADAGCRLVQGWLYSAAVPPDEVLPMLVDGVVPAAHVGGVAGRRAV